MVFNTTILDFILIGLVLEAAILALWLRNREAQRLMKPLIAFLAAGFLLILLTRLALSDVPSGALALVLGLAGGAHVVCLRQAFKLFMDRRSS